MKELEDLMDMLDVGVHVQVKNKNVFIHHSWIWGENPVSSNSLVDFLLDLEVHEI